MSFAAIGELPAGRKREPLNRDQPLSCALAHTTGEFLSIYTEALSDIASRGLPVECLAETGDTVCALALRFHTLLYHASHMINELSIPGRRCVPSILAATHFIGTWGRFRFIPGIPNPASAVRLEQVRGDVMASVARDADASSSMDRRGYPASRASCAGRGRHPP